MNLDWLGYEDIPFFAMLFLYSLIIYFFSKPKPDIEEEE